MKQSNSGVLWIVGGVMGLLLLGCMLTLVASLFIVRSDRSVSTARVQTSVAAPARPVALQATPPPPVVIATPEAGLDYESAALRNIYLQVNPSVVNVNVLGAGSSLTSLFPDAAVPHNLDPNDLFSISSGSGFVWDTDGHIVTNNHVVEGADEVQITFADQRVAIAQVVGADVDSDLAVLKIDPDGYALTPIRRGHLEDVFVGMRVAAIGNPFGLGTSMSLGIVSAVGRSIPSGATPFAIPLAIQTDTAINPGNSGGPLLNLDGQVIGVNAQIRTTNGGANSGVGFAIPADVVRHVAPQLIEFGVQEWPWLGVEGGSVNLMIKQANNLDSQRGAYIAGVVSGGPA
ncbi:MAG: trypsin-like peptidase domain-containing protein, partial [Caldilineaceae bacterium]|nr:trypsin-like peptidase domain-containing protein [Caldilineaceae bacterium]